MSAAEAQGIGLQMRDPMSSRFQQNEMIAYGFTVLSASLGTLALAMASVGLYGLMTFAVNQRVREVGIRMSLGATAENVVALIMRQGLRLVLIGLALGLIGGALFAKLLEKILFGLFGTFDPATVAVVTLLFAIIALFACWLPARRAAKMDPNTALRAE
jgi:putative ABC transport system permease protein